MTAYTDPPGWVADAVFYQVFPDRFASSSRVPKPGPLEPWDAPPTHHGFKGGDLLGIVERLDYLADLGVTALYLNPVFASASNHRYHTYDYFHVDPLLGGDDALRELLDASHSHGIRVVLDGVFNHSGRGFWPFHHVVENGIASPYVDWFHVNRDALASGWSLRPYPTPEEDRQLHDDASAEGHRLGDVTLRHLGYRAWWDLPALPKLNTDNPQMREHLMESAEHWLRFGIDGWRLDVAEEIDAGFWREFRQRVRAVNPEAYIVAEIWQQKPHWVSGDTFDALMNYPLAQALLGFTAAHRLDGEVVASQQEYRQYVHPMDGPAFAQQLDHLMHGYRPEAARAQLNLLGSHDTPRYVTVAGGDLASLRLAVLAVMTLPGSPCIYYGDEIGMEGRHDPDCRRAFPWHEAAWDHELREYVRAAISLRASQPVLRHGEYRTLAAAGNAVAWGLYSADAAAVTVLNADDRLTQLRLPADALPGDDVQPAALPGMAMPRLSRLDTGELEVELAGRSGCVLLNRAWGQ